MKRKKSANETRIYKYGCLVPNYGAQLIDEQVRFGYEYQVGCLRIERERILRQDEAVCRLMELAKMARAAADVLEAAYLSAVSALKADRAATGATSLLLATQVKAQKGALIEALRALHESKAPLWALLKALTPLRAERAGEWRTMKASLRGLPEAAVEAGEAKFLAETEELFGAFVRAKSPDLLEVWLALHRIAMDCNQRRKALYNASPAVWGTRAVVNKAVESAVEAVTGKRPAKKARKLTAHPALPKFPLNDGQGRVAVQLQKGLTLTELLSGEDTRLQVQISAEALALAKKPRGVVRLRVGSEGRKPVWVELPLVLHRPFPKDAVIMWAWIRRTCAGPAHALTSNGHVALNWRYEMQFTLEAPRFDDSPKKSKAPKRARISSVSIDLGWRGHDAGERMLHIRLGYWRNSLGNQGELKVPEGLSERLEFAESLRSIKADNFNAMRTRLGEWLSNGPAAPEWLTEALRTLPHWRSAARLARLHARWAQNRFPADVEVLRPFVPPWRAAALPNRAVLGQLVSGLSPRLSIFDWVTEWRRQDEHLWTWEARQRRKALLYRKEQYRILAKQLALEYSQVVMEDMDLTNFAAYPEPEDGLESEDESSRRLRTQTAPSEFREALKYASRKFGAKFVEVDPRNTTQTCSACGHLNVWKTKPKIHHTCVKCGTQWDQDDNAARNIERLGGEAGA